MVQTLDTSPLTRSRRSSGSVKQSIWWQSNVLIQAVAGTLWITEDKTLPSSLRWSLDRADCGVGPGPTRELVWEDETRSSAQCFQCLLVLLIQVFISVEVLLVWPLWAPVSVCSVQYSTPHTPPPQPSSLSNITATICVGHHGHIVQTSSIWWLLVCHSGCSRALWALLISALLWTHTGFKSTCVESAKCERHRFSRGPNAGISVAKKKPRIHLAS